MDTQPTFDAYEPRRILRSSELGQDLELLRKLGIKGPIVAHGLGLTSIGLGIEPQGLSYYGCLPRLTDSGLSTISTLTQSLLEHCGPDQFGMRKGFGGIALNVWFNSQGRKNDLTLLTCPSPSAEFKARSTRIGLCAVAFSDKTGLYTTPAALHDFSHREITVAHSDAAIKGEQDAAWKMAETIQQECPAYRNFRIIRQDAPKAA